VTRRRIARSFPFLPDPPALIATLCGLLPVVLAVTVLYGWHIHSIAHTQISPRFASMQYSTAVCFLFTGIGLSAHALGLPRIISLICGFLAGMTGWLLSIEYLTGARLGFDLLLPLLPGPPGEIALPPSPPASVCFALSGTAIALLASRISESSRRFGVWAFGSLALSLSAMAVCGYATGLSGTYVWGQFVGMALHTAIGMAVISIGLLVTQMMNGNTILLDRWLPVPVAIGTVTATLILWQGLLSDRYSALQARTKFVAQNLQSDAVVRMDGPLRALERMKQRWDVRGAPPHLEWEHDAREIVADESVFATLEWVDSSLRIQWVVPPEDAYLVGQDLTTDGRWDIMSALAESRRSGTTVLSPTIELRQGGMGFLAYCPLFPGGKFDGFLVGVFQIGDIVATLLERPQFANYDVSVFEDGALIFQSPFRTAGRGLPQVESAVDFRDHQWRFVVSPRSANAVSAQSNLPNVIVVLGLLLASALTVAVRALQVDARHAWTIRQVNDTLEKEIVVRRGIEERLRESEERLRAFLDSATGISVISADSSGIIRYFSRGAEKMLGYSAEEMVGMVTPGHFHDADEVAARGAELSAELGRPVEGFQVFVSLPVLHGSERREWTYVCKDGTRRTVDLTVTVLGGGSGAITGYLGTALDITERKEMEQRLRDTVRAMETAQALLKAAGRIAHLGHWELPLDGSGPKWSDITCAIHEVPPGTTISLMEALHFFHPEDRHIVRDHVQQVRRGGEPFEFEARLITAMGREIWVHTRGEPVRDESGSIVALRGVLQDVDERHRAAELLEERNEELEVAKARAEANARAKAEFLANMSHEIRTPLNAVIGMADLLRDAELGSHERELAETIRTSGDVLLALINDILDFSKIESGQLELERIPIRLRECVESALDLLAGPAAKKGLDLLCWIDPAVPIGVLGDLTRFRQIIVNLVSNAIKFTSDGEVFVKLSKRSGADGGEWLHVSVRDSGIGIPAERMDRLFQAFSQVDASTTRRYGGTGLGLAISHRLVEMMHGRIWVESEPGRGSDFQFEIPLYATEIPSQPSSSRRSARSMEGMRALIVDDNATNRWILQMQTESWGMTSVLATGHDQALEQIRSAQPFDIAILDVMMPEMDGYGLVIEIRKHRSKEELPIVILTSVGEQGRDQEALGISGVLTKPVKTAALFNVLADILSVAHEERPVIATPRQAAKINREHPLHVLVAEDNPVNQRVTDLLLQRLGYRAMIVSNGFEVLEALERSTYDVILLDIQMPEMDGMEAAREICRLYPQPKRPWMIALTAHALEGDREECLAVGLNDYLSKPLRGEELRSALLQASERKKRSTT
jgi:PAS domain S-box-containing protein